MQVNITILLSNTHQQTSEELNNFKTRFQRVLQYKDNSKLISNSAIFKPFIFKGKRPLGKSSYKTNQKGALRTDLNLLLWYLWYKLTWKHGTIHRFVWHSGQWYFVFLRKIRPCASIVFQQKLQPRAGPGRRTGQWHDRDPSMREGDELWKYCESMNGKTPTLTKHVYTLYDFIIEYRVRTS